MAGWDTAKKVAGYSALAVGVLSVAAFGPAVAATKGGLLLAEGVKVGALGATEVSGMVTKGLTSGACVPSP